MKTNLLRLLPGIFFVLFGNSILAQDTCSDYLLLHDKAQYEILTYNQKDKLTGKIAYKVKEVTDQDGVKKATIASKIYDNKDKLSSEGEFTIECNKGTISMDMRSMMNPATMEAYKEMEMTMEGDRMLYPSNLTAGQKLEDGTMVLEIKDKQSGQVMTTMTMRVVDRTVEGKESIQVPAGTYQGYKISQNTEMENKAMGIKMPGMKVQTIEYFVPNIGMVRSETYRNGKLMSYSVLSKVSK